jgi:hypothetical protein
MSEEKKEIEKIKKIYFIVHKKPKKIEKTKLMEKIR